MKPLLIVAGTRPEIIKMAPVVKELHELDVDTVYVWSGQHYDYLLSRLFFEQLELSEPDEHLNVGSGTHAEQTAKVMLGLEGTIMRYKPKIVVAEGDTNTVAAAAMTSVKCKVPFMHVEAGLRSWNMTMPEEINRKIADSVATIHFAPSKLAAINLLFEGSSPRGVYLTGNTVVDVIYHYTDEAQEAGEELLGQMNLGKGQYILATVHRAENTENSDRLRNILAALKSLNEQFRVVFSLHPRTMHKIIDSGMINYLDDIAVLPPIGYFEFLGLLMNCAAVLTDSGGVQEEAFTLKVPTVTLRYDTERPETLIYGVNVLAGADTQQIVSLTSNQLKRCNEIKRNNISNPFGDGHAGERIARVIKRSVEGDLKIEELDLRRTPLITYKLIPVHQVTDKRNFEAIVGFDEAGKPNLTKNWSENDRWLVRVKELYDTNVIGSY